MHINCANWTKPVDRLKIRWSTVFAQNAQITCTHAHNVYIFEFLSTGPFLTCRPFLNRKQLFQKTLLFSKGCISYLSSMIITLNGNCSQRVTTIFLYIYSSKSLIQTQVFTRSYMLSNLISNTPAF
jgi:hypothetical protein